MLILFARTYVGSQDEVINKISVQLVLFDGSFAELFIDYSTRRIIKYTVLSTFSSFQDSLCRFKIYTSAR